MIAAYSGSCSSLSLVDAAGPVAQGQLLTITPYLAPSSSTSNLYIRVAITASSGGYFDITIQTNI